MRQAVIDISGEVLPCVATLIDGGLKFVGSLTYGLSDEEAPDTVRLIVVDEFNRVLPPECDSGFWLVKPLMTLETYGVQRMTKLSSVSLIGKIIFGANGRSKIEYPQAA